MTDLQRIRDELKCALNMGGLRQAAEFAVQELDKAISDTGRLEFMLQGHRKVVVERLPHGNSLVYVEEGFMGDKRYPGVCYSGDWSSGAPEAQEIQREAIDVALAAGASHESDD